MKLAPLLTLLAVGDAKRSKAPLATSRGSNFATGAAVNTAIMADFNLGRTTLMANQCSSMRAIADRVIAIGYVPIVQGVLKYAWTIDDSRSASLSASNALKYRAEAAVFAAGMLGRLNACSPAAATTVYDNTKIGGTSTNFAAVKAALEGCYENMGITCANVGGYVNSDGTYRTGFAAGCTVAGTLAGYVPATDVVEHSEIDLDQRDIETALSAVRTFRACSRDPLLAAC